MLALELAMHRRPVRDSDTTIEMMVEISNDDQVKPFFESIDIIFRI